jgi:hypothetical protein
MLLSNLIEVEVEVTFGAKYLTLTGMVTSCIVVLLIVHSNVSIYFTQQPYFNKLIRWKFYLNKIYFKCKGNTSNSIEHGRIILVTNRVSYERTCTHLFYPNCPDQSNKFSSRERDLAWSTQIRADRCQGKLGETFCTFSL